MGTPTGNRESTNLAGKNHGFKLWVHNNNYNNNDKVFEIAIQLYCLHLSIKVFEVYIDLAIEETNFQMALRNNKII